MRRQSSSHAAQIFVTLRKQCLYLFINLVRESYLERKCHALEHDTLIPARVRTRTARCIASPPPPSPNACRVMWSRPLETILPRVTLAEVTFSLFLCKINHPFTLGLRTRLGWRDNTGGRACCLASVGRVTPASGTTFLYLNPLVRLTGLASVT